MLHDFIPFLTCISVKLKISFHSLFNNVPLIPFTGDVFFLFLGQNKFALLFCFTNGGQ